MTAAEYWQASNRNLVSASFAAGLPPCCGQSTGVANLPDLSAKGRVMGDRSGVGLVELAVLETLGALTGGRPRAYVQTAEAVAGTEERIGLGPRYGYEVLTGLVQPWIMPIRLVAGHGNFGDRSSPTRPSPSTPRAAPRTWASWCWTPRCTGCHRSQ